MAWHFNEVDQYVLLADNAVLTLPDSDWTLAGWIKLDDNTGSAFQYFFSWGSLSASPSLNMIIGENSGPSQVDDLTINIEDSGGDDNTSTADNNIFNSNTAWTHIVVRRTGSAVAAYVDGTLNSTNTNAAFDAVDVAADMNFGRRSDNNSARFFGGDMAEWAFWDRLFSTDEISAAATGYAPSFFRENLVWYLPMVREYQEVVQGLTVTNNGSTVVQHVPIIYPAPTYMPRLTVAAAAATGQLLSIRHIQNFNRELVGGMR